MATQAPVLKQLQCPNCGAALKQHLATSQAIVCSSCHSHVAIGMEEAKILSKGTKIPAPPVPIFPGDKAKLNNVDYFVMGRVVYRGWDDEDRWHWHEWMLGGADGSLVWLSYSDDEGFVMFRKLRVRVPFDADFGDAIPTGNDGHFAPVVERYPAKILAAEGELTWQAKLGEDLKMVEGKLGNTFYSVQKTETELEIYEGIAITTKEVAEAFGHKKWKEAIESRGETRSVILMVASAAVVLAIISACAGLVLGGMNGQAIQTQNFVLNSAQPVATFPVAINGRGRPAKVELQMNNTLPMNTFAGVEVSVTDPTGDDLYELSNDFWHESGYDEGYWEESDYKASGRFVPPQGGNYTVEVALGERSPGVGQMNVQVSVYENTFLPSWFWIYAVLTAIVGCLLFFWAYSNYQSKGMS
jgi:hypothetical protein